MIADNIYSKDFQTLMVKKIADYSQLVKLRLSMLVVFSAMISFLLGSEQVDWLKLLLLIAGGFLITGAANGFNQVIEKDLDKLMTRTSGRPLPAGNMSVREGLLASTVMGITGALILGIFVNALTGVLGLLAFASYAFVYTPMKQRTPFAVFIGAIPGALPPMLGWVAATGVISAEAWILFGIQFIWQFPHFWAIAWVLDEDYKKAGFSLLPSPGRRDQASAFQVMLYTLILIPVSLLPLRFGMAGAVTGVIAIVCGTIFFIQSVNLYRTCSIKAAARLMFSSFIYLPVIQLALLIDKLIG